VRLTGRFLGLLLGSKKGMLLPLTFSKYPTSLSSVHELVWIAQTRLRPTAILDKVRSYPIY